MSYSDVDGSDSNSEGSSHEDDDNKGDELGSDSTIHDGSVSNRNEDSGSESDVGSSDSSVELEGEGRENTVSHSSIKRDVLYSVLATWGTSISSQHYTIIFAIFVKKYKLISHVVHSHINDPFGPVGIVAFGGSPFETLARE